MAETDELWLERRQTQERPPVEGAVCTETGRRQSQPRPSRKEMNVGNDVARNKDAIGVPKERDVAWSVARCFDDPEATDHVSFFQQAIDLSVGPGPYLVPQANDADIRLHGLSAFHRRAVALVAGKGNLQLFTNAGSRSLVVRVTVSQRELTYGLATNLTQDACGSPARAGVDKHIFKKVRVEEIFFEATELPNTVRNPMHGADLDLLSEMKRTKKALLLQCKRSKRARIYLVAPAAAKATATAATTAAEATTGAAAATAAAATTAIFAGTSFIHGQDAATVFLAIESGNRGLSFLIGAHLDKSESLGATGVPVHDDLSRSHGSVRFEHLRQLAVGHTIRKVADIKLPTHLKSPLPLTLHPLARGAPFEKHVTILPFAGGSCTEQPVLFSHPPCIPESVFQVRQGRCCSKFGEWRPLDQSASP